MSKIITVDVNSELWKQGAREWELLKGKQLLRMFDGKSMLNAGEQIIEINGLKYVVKESK